MYVLVVHGVDLILQAFARRGLAKINELSNLESLSSSVETPLSEITFRTATVKVTFPPSVLSPHHHVHVIVIVLCEKEVRLNSLTFLGRRKESPIVLLENLLQILV